LTLPCTTGMAAVGPFFTFLLAILPVLQHINAFTLRKDSEDSHVEGFVLSQALEAKEVPACWTEERPKFRLLTRHLEQGEDLSHLVILIHGFYSRPSVWADGLAQLILAKDDTRKHLGVLVIDWEESSRWKNVWEPWTDYRQAVKNTRCLAEFTAALLEQLSSRPSIHCVGHSLGAHVCGFLSNKLQENNGGRRMERITGLDPAGIDWTTRLVGVMKVEPLPVLPHVDTRLDASDADFVDVIHTDANFAGMMQPSGDVDFYVGRTLESLGSSQKDCGCKDNCDHARSFKLFTESVSQQIKADKVFQCAETKALSLEGCQEESKDNQPVIGYFVNEDVKGLVGVLIPSDAVEMPCLKEVIESEEEEDDWDDDWDDDWGEDWEEDKDDDWTEEEEEEEDEEERRVEGETVETNFFSALTAKINLQLPDGRALFNFDKEQLENENEVEKNQKSSTRRGGWPGSPMPDCDFLCLSLLSATGSFFFLTLVIFVYGTVKMLRKTKDNF